MAVLTKDEQEFLRKQLHSKAMQCHQCDLVERLLQADEESP